MVDAQGRAQGFSVDLLRAALSAMNRSVTFRTGPWSKVRGWLEKGEVQALPLVGRTPEREALFDFTFPYMTLHGAIVVRNKTRDIETLKDLKGRRVAVMEGDNAEEFLRREKGDFEIITTTTFEEALQDLSRGRCEAVVVQRLVAMRLLQETGLQNLRIVPRPIEGFQQAFCFAVKKGDSPTLALLNEGLALVMADGTYRHLHAKWFAALELPSNRRIIIGGDKDYPPFEYLDELGRPAGLAVEMTKAIARERGLEVVFRLGTWSQILEEFERGDIDVIQGMFYSSERDLKYDFSQPYAASTYVSVVRQENGSPPPSTWAGLANRPLVIQQGDVIHSQLQEQGYTGPLTLVETQEEVLQAVAEGQQDCGIVVRFSALELIDKRGWSNLKLGKQPLQAVDYCYAVRQGDSALLATFSEGLRTLEKSGEYRRLHDHWLGVHEPLPPDFKTIVRYVVMVAVPLLLILLASIVWLKVLRRQVVLRTQALHDSERLLATILEAIPAPVFYKDREGVYSGCNLALTQFIGRPKEEIIGKTAFEVAPADLAQRYHEADLALMASEEIQVYEAEVESSAGERRQAIFHKAPYRDEQGQIIGIVGAIMDITERTKAEQALRESEAFIKAVMDNLPIGVAVNSIDPAVDFLYMNDKFPEIYRTTREALTDPDHFWEAVYQDPVFREEIKQRVLADVASGDPQRLHWYDIPIAREGERTTYISACNAVVPGKPLMISIVWEVTDRIAAEEALQQSTALQRAMIACSPLAVYSLDREGVVLSWNEAAENMFGWQAEEVIGQPLPIIPEDRQQEFAELRGRILAGKQFAGVELLRLRQNGELLNVSLSAAPIRDAEGQVVAIMATMEDITERKQAEHALRQFKTIFDTASYGAAVSDAEGRLIYVNQFFAQVHGFELEEVTGQDIGIFHNQEQMEQVKGLLDQMLREGSFQAEEVWHCRRDGTVFPMLMSGMLVRDSEGVAQSFTVTAIDLTERKALEAQLQQIQKMESIGRLAGGVAHDFNNMLSVILGHAQLALMKAPPDTPVHPHLSEIERTAKRSAGLTQQLLAFARKQTIAPTVLDLNDTVEGMLKMLRRLIGEDLDLAWLPHAGLWPLKMDPAQVDQILANLCVNSRDAIAGVGKVTIETNNVSLSEAYCATHADCLPGDYVMLAVSDDGCGMDQETLANIFEPFFTTKPIDQGTGLGLATVYGIVKQNNGFINVYSEPGEGSTFRIYLPRHVGEAAEQSSTDTPEMPLSQGEIVLLVEDDPAIMQMGLLMLEELGYEVLTANTPAEALALAARHEVAIDLLITDVVMPEMDGRRLSNQLTELYPQLKTLFMSGYTANVIAHRGVLDEGVVFLQKPFAFETLAAKVRDALKA
jgi:two-component system sensor histidine kinase EvgS